MNFLYAWAVKGSIGFSCFVGSSCISCSVDKRIGTSVIVWTDVTGGKLPDFVIHSNGIQTRTKDNKPVILWRN